MNSCELDYILFSTTLLNDVIISTFLFTLFITWRLYFNKAHSVSSLESFKDAISDSAESELESIFAAELLAAKNNELKQLEDEAIKAARRKAKRERNKTRIDLPPNNSTSISNENESNSFSVKHEPMEEDVHVVSKLVLMPAAAKRLSFQADENLSLEDIMREKISTEIQSQLSSALAAVINNNVSGPNTLSSAADPSTDSSCVPKDHGDATGSFLSLVQF